MNRMNRRIHLALAAMFLTGAALLMDAVIGGYKFGQDRAFAETSAPQADPARLSAARELMEATGVTRQLDTMIEVMKTGFAKGAQAETSEAGKAASGQFDAAMAKFMSYKQNMLDDFAVLYSETFTAEEMTAIAAFYRSGPGAKFVAAMPELMQKGSQIGMKYSMRAQSDTVPETAPPPAKND